MTVGKFSFPANIHHFQFWIERQIHCKFICIYIYDEVDAFTRILPGFKSALEVSAHLCETHAGQSDDTFFFFSRIGYQYKRFVEGKEAACPFCETAIQADAD